ncbi:hypothetical protein ACFLWA_10195 [Chloroflexota bacterium]
MGALRRLGFFLGLVMGLAVTAVTGALVLTYLFTGKFPIPEMAEDSGGVQLMTPDEVVAVVREQVGKARAEESFEVQGGDSDDEA